ncbi:MAG: IS66 family insertion sequence element accessory protein TnpB [Planctomycetaceae bacterium]
MLSLPSRTKMFLCIHPVDMRKSFDGLTGIVKEEFRQDPINGLLFLFVNKRRDRMKAIFWDDDGFVIWYKRLEAGTWQLPIVPASLTAGVTTLELEAHELAMILRGIDLKSARRRARYQQPVAV